MSGEDAHLVMQVCALVALLSVRIAAKCYVIIVSPLDIRQDAIFVKRTPRVVMISNSVNCAKKSHAKIVMRLLWTIVLPVI